MGCDYYLTKEIHIDYINSKGNYKKTFYEYGRKSGYFFDYDLDSDDENFEEKYRDRRNQELNNIKTKDDIIIFDNGSYTSEFLKNKYKLMIKQAIEREEDCNFVIKSNFGLSWSYENDKNKNSLNDYQIIKAVKVEYVEER